MKNWSKPYNAFLELQTKFFHKQRVIWSFLQSVNEFHHKWHIFNTSGSILKQSTMRKNLQKEVYLPLPLRFFKYNEKSPNLVYP